MKGVLEMFLEEEKVNPEPRLECRVCHTGLDQLEIEENDGYCTTCLNKELSEMVDYPSAKELL